MRKNYFLYQYFLLPVLSLLLFACDNTENTDSDKNEEDWKLTNYKWKNIFDDLKKI